MSLTPRPTKPLPFVEFVILLALMISVSAMSIDVMLPALGQIAEDLNLADRNDAQLVVSAFFFGFAIGQIFVGPLSDRFGRKAVIGAGYLVFICGCFLSMLTESWTAMLIGRVLQGIGAAGPRIVAVALVRDGYEGRAMARIMSVIMAVFIVVPAIAPAIGQVLIFLGGWRITFAWLACLAVVAVSWLFLRQPETLPKGDQRSLALSSIGSGLCEILSIRKSVGYTIATGLITGAFLGYLSSAQQIFQTTYLVGDAFALYFGGAALAIGAASFLNSRIVMKFGMRRLVLCALSSISIISLAFLAVSLVSGISPSLMVFMCWLLAAFFCIGLTFGNLNALAMEPLGHMAGLGAAFVGSVATFISLPLGWTVGQAFNGSALPLVAGFAALGICSLATVYHAE